MLDLRWVFWSFCFTHGKHILYAQIEGTVLSTNSEDFYGKNPAALLADLLFYCQEMDYMHHLHKYKEYYLIDI